MASREDRAKEFTRIYERDGCVRPSVVVKEATPKKSILHDDYEWDDKIAAHEHRLSQARRYIRITVVRNSAGVESRFVHVPCASEAGPTANVMADREGVYRPIIDVVKQPDDYEKALMQLISQRNAMDDAIKELQRAVRNDEKRAELLPQLVDALDVAKRILTLMRNAA